MNRIERKFLALKKQKKKAFIAFITAGYPSLKVTEQLIYEFDRIGVDILELGVPFSDPMADGPVIQEASGEALKKDAHLIDILNLVKKARRKVNMPLCLMTYYNPIFCFGEDKFIGLSSKYGVDGVIIPDLPPEEGRGFIKSANKAGLDVICFIAPTTTAERAKHIAGISRGFIYYVSLTGTTGARRKLPSDLIGHLRSIKKLTSKPLCVGFGISSREQVKKIQKASDGVIVGSAIIKKIKENIHRPALVKRVGSFVNNLKA